MAEIPQIQRCTCGNTLLVEVNEIDLQQGIGLEHNETWGFICPIDQKLWTYDAETKDWKSFAFIGGKWKRADA